jgi:hypothetical protein
MKKLLIIGFVLAVCVLAFPQGVMAATDTDYVNVYATYYTATDFSATRIDPSGGWVWDLVPGGDNEVDPAIRIHLITQSDWYIDAADTTPGQVRDGYLLGSLADPDKTLQSPFHVKNKAGEYVDLTSSKTLASGNSLNTEQGWNAAINQPVVAADYGSTTGYTAQITFTCTTGF